ncbi:MAG: HAD hydrolase-like protein [Candidatus ainarchaeum sp.]|nr:HAD hydrolase-like protein [Candidatus ainarchaeum sp.]
MKESAIFFDLDDTLVDLADTHTQIYNILLPKYDINIPHCEHTLNTILDGRSIRDSFWRDFDSLDDRTKFIRENRITLKPNVHSVMEYLHKKYDLFLVTNTPLYKAELELDLFGLKKYFKEFFFAETTQLANRKGIKKPDIKIIGDLKHSHYKEKYMVGDSNTDLLFAKEIDAKFILVSHEKNGHINGHKKVIKNLAELKKIL